MSLSWLDFRINPYKAPYCPALLFIIGHQFSVPLAPGFHWQEPTPVPYQQSMAAIWMFLFSRDMNGSNSLGVFQDMVMGH